MNFLSYLWKKYKISKAKAKLKKEMEEVLEETKDLSANELDAKYDGNFARFWALKQGELFKLIEREKEL